jgi:GT2 family glycosyltransferase
MTPTAKRLVVVLGMHRSGTSALTRALKIMGVDLGERLMPGLPTANDKGFFEDIDLNDLNERMLRAVGSEWQFAAPLTFKQIEQLQDSDFCTEAIHLLKGKSANTSIFGFKDPRIAKLLQFWQHVFSRCRFRVSYLLVVRNPLSVAKSLEARDGFPHEKSHSLWCSHVIESLSLTKELSRVLIDYDRFLSSPETSLAAIAEGLALKINNRQLKEYVSDFLDEHLRHSVFSLDDLSADRACPPLVSDVYAGLTEVAADNRKLNSQWLYELTSQWAAEYKRAQSTLRWMDSLAWQVKELKSEIASRDEEIRSVFRTAVKHNSNVFLKSFDSQRYLTGNPDVAAAGVDPYEHFINTGIAEGRLTASGLTGLIREAVLLYSQKEIDYVSGAALQTDTQLRIAELEQDLPRRLSAISNEHERQLLQASQALEKTLVAQLARNNQSSLDALESHELNMRGQYEALSTLKKTHSHQLAELRQKNEDLLLDLNNREKEWSSRLLESEITHGNKLRDESETFAAKEHAYLQQIAHEQARAEARIIEILNAEKECSNRISEIQRLHEDGMREQGATFALRDRDCQEKVHQLERRIESLVVEGADRERGWLERQSATQKAHDAHLRTYAEECAQREGRLRDQSHLRERALTTEVEGAREELREATREFLVTLQSSEVRERTAAQSMLVREREWGGRLMDLQLQVANLTRDIAARDAGIQSLEARFSRANNELEESHQHNARLAESGNAREMQIANLDGIIRDRDSQISALERRLALHNPPQVVPARDLAELLQYQAREFVVCAYKTLLDRDPDRRGEQFYLNRVLNGTPKIQILMEIADSEEARKRGVVVNGLEPAMKRYRSAQNVFYRALFGSFADVDSNSVAENRLRAIEQRIYAETVARDAQFSELMLRFGELRGRGAVMDSAAGTVSPDWIPANGRPLARRDSPALNEEKAETVADGTWEWSQYESVKERIRKELNSRRELFVARPAEMIDIGDQPFTSIAAKIALPLPGKSPDVSIILPVFNNLKLTLECLSSISQASDPQVTFEVLLRDDASTDDTVKVLSTIKHLRLVRNSENLGFLQNCNRALADVRGKHVVFLNNDAQVCQGWLIGLLATFSQYPRVGAVGPRFIYPSGHLQEVGAAFRFDATADMVGHGEAPDQLRYSYARRVDYSSGACLMLPTDLIKELNGFSEEFLPCYCEDSDLCLRVQEAGYFVYCNPAVTITHHLSKTTAPLNENFKYRCVAKNLNTLAGKWANRLERSAFPRVLAFYLPQFHPFPENNAWWGEGFTEWTNVSKAQPNFQGHYQPRLPADLGYYDLRLPEVMVKQAELAQSYGIDGFCFYYYWFAGKRLLEFPLEQMLSLNKPDFPFCLCWANENWSRRWDGLNSEILIAQQHSAEDDIAVIKDLCRYFRDHRYIRIDERPLVLIYRVQLFPSFLETAARWRTYCREQGIGEIYIAMVESFELVHSRTHPSKYGCDAAVEFPPQELAEPKPPSGTVINTNFEGSVGDYRDLAVRFATRELPPYVRFKGIMPGWDNTARMQNKSFCFEHATPGAFQAWLEEAIEQTRTQYYGDERLIFVNAWNEWAEGTYLEPDRRYGHGFLEAVRNSKQAAILLRKSKYSLGE